MNQPPNDGRPGQSHNPYDPRSGVAGPDPTRQFPANPYGGDHHGNPYAGNQYGGNPYGGQHYGGPQHPQQPQQFGWQHQYGGQQQFGQPYGAPNSYGNYGGPQQPGGASTSAGTNTGLIIAAIIGVVVLAVVAVGVVFAFRDSGDDSGGIALPTTSSAAPTADPNPGGSPRSSEPFAPSEPSAPSAPSAPSSTAVAPPPGGSEGGTNVRLEATSSTGSEITVTYVDTDLNVQQEDVPSPWSTELTSSGGLTAVSLLVFQVDEGDVTCKIFVDDEEVDSNTATGSFQSADCVYYG